MATSAIRTPEPAPAPRTGEGRTEVLAGVAAGVRYDATRSPAVPGPPAQDPRRDRGAPGDACPPHLDSRRARGDRAPLRRRPSRLPSPAFGLGRWPRATPAVGEERDVAGQPLPSKNRCRASVSSTTSIAGPCTRRPG